MDAAGYAPSDPLITLRELVRVIKPGGKLILANWSSQSLLPGYPVLEAHLNATSVGIAPFSRDSQPNSHFLYSLSWMRELGLEDAHAETFVHTVFAPLAPEIQRALIALIDMRWASAQAEVSPGDWQLYLRLSKPDSPEFILNNPGYLAFFTYSVFSAKVPE
jgi:demethylmenaquinone methyltransferase/2-methoxy-6-polyprenyl-1,4-benzoquinol methylase